jgi:hypothetical protein
MFVIKTDRPAVEITHNGEVTKWEYDIVVLKLEMDRIAEKSKRKQPEAGDLQEFADFLAGLGMPHASPDVALRMWSLVTVQFSKLATSIAEQVQQALTHRGA